MLFRRCRPLCMVASALAFVGVLLAVGLVLSPELIGAPVPPGPKPGDAREFMIAAGVKMVFCWVPPGTAQLGSPKAEQDYYIKTLLDGKRADWLDAEAEIARGVYRSKGFWLGKYEVTQGEWTAVMGGNPSVFDGTKDNEAKGMKTERFPADSVSWDNCQEFLKKVNTFGSANRDRFSLPHEDEWEYAYRGGNGNGRAFYWGDDLNGDKANCDGNHPYRGTAKGPYLERTTEVGSYAPKAPHPWGLCDMSGNVWEWCDNNNKQSYNRPAFRGGSWITGAWGCRAAYRGEGSPVGRSDVIGFRVCFRLD